MNGIEKSVIIDMQAVSVVSWLKKIKSFDCKNESMVNC